VGSGVGSGVGVGVGVVAAGGPGCVGDVGVSSLPHAANGNADEKMSVTITFFMVVRCMKNELSFPHAAFVQDDLQNAARQACFVVR
jgi:hypothetical protein